MGGFSRTLLFPPTQGARSRTSVSVLPPPARSSHAALPYGRALPAACTYFAAVAASPFFAGMVPASNIATDIAKEGFLLYFSFCRACFSYRQDLPVWLRELHPARAAQQRPGDGRGEADLQAGDQLCVSQRPPSPGKSRRAVMISLVWAEVWTRALSFAPHTPEPCWGRAEGTAGVSAAVAKLLWVTGSDLQAVPQASPQPASLREGARASPALLPSVPEPPRLKLP